MVDQRTHAKLILCFLVLLISMLLLGCSSYPDSPAEEALEAKIREYTGVDIDFTSTDDKD